MIQKSTEFYRNLPPKTCSECGNRLSEQHESYLSVCHNCLAKTKK